MTDLKPIDYVYGTFQNEIKNRFLCSVNIDGKDVICYIPSSCRLSNFIDMTGRTVLLRPIEASNAKYSRLGIPRPANVKSQSTVLRLFRSILLEK